MEDHQIIDLYWKRDESAITETDCKYGIFCHRIAMNLLSVHEDAEECVSDAYLQAWNSMPPQRPKKLKLWLGQVVRNIAINLWHKSHAKKRYNGVDQLLSELEDTIPSNQNVEREIENAELGAMINEWLLSLPEDDRNLFVHRYWHGIALNELARRRNIPPQKLAQKMYRLRLSLKSFLEKECGLYDHD